MTTDQPDPEGRRTVIMPSGRRVTIVDVDPVDASDRGFTCILPAESGGGESDLPAPRAPGRRGPWRRLMDWLGFTRPQTLV